MALRAPFPTVFSQTGNESTAVAELCVRAEGGLGLCVWTPNNELSCESVDRNVGKKDQSNYPLALCRAAHTNSHTKWIDSQKDNKNAHMHQHTKINCTLNKVLICDWPDIITSQPVADQSKLMSRGPSRLHLRRIGYCPCTPGSKMK